MKVGELLTDAHISIHMIHDNANRIAEGAKSGTKMFM
jgi:hypothetical protein